MRFFLILLIKIYRWAISPLVGPCCRFEPSCSAYAEEALRTHGALRGVGLTVWRLARCHPFGRGGLDPVPRRG
jgi:putative membrane protein insertion efficiency factor